MVMWKSRNLRPSAQARAAREESPLPALTQDPGPSMWAAGGKGRAADGKDGPCLWVQEIHDSPAALATGTIPALEAELGEAVLAAPFLAQEQGKAATLIQRWEGQRHKARSPGSAALAPKAAWPGGTVPGRASAASLCL